MDSYEMSVTSTDCQYPNCSYVASVYTYPYCHEHKTLSPYYVPGSPVGPPLGGTKQQVNDLNKDRDTKSSSLTEQSSSSSSSQGKGCMQREHSRSLEDIHAPTERGPGYVHESKPDWCKVSGCKLMGHPENQFLCAQHYTEMRLPQKRAKDKLNNGRNYDQEQKTLPMEKVEEWLKNGEHFRSTRVNRLDDSLQMTTDNILTPLNQTLKCKNDNCREPGNRYFQGLCTNCYLKLDIGGDTEPLERPHVREENREEAEIGKEEDRKSLQTLNERKDDVNIDNNGLESLQDFRSSTDEKRERSRADTQEFNKCKKDTCNRLAPSLGTEGFCTDCHSKAQDSAIIEPPSPQNYTEPGLRVDTASTAYAASISNPPSHYVRNVSLQSFPTVPVKQSYPSKSYQPVGSTTMGPPPMSEEVSRCATSGCCGICVNLDKNGTGLCFKCLKERKKVARKSSVESGNPEIQANQTMQGESLTANGDAQHLLPRFSGGRRSGRKRHTIAIPPSLPHRTHSMEVSREETCVSPLCNKIGSTKYGGFCKDCFEWMSLKVEQFDIQGVEQDRMAPCATEGCEFYGIPATRGYCSQCFRKQQNNSGKEVTFGMERRYSSGRSITPPPGPRGQLCANQFCDQYGHQDCYNFCQSCFKTFDACTGISYSPPPARGSFVPPSTSHLDMESFYWSPPANNVPPPLPTRAAHFVPPIDIDICPSDTWGASYYPPHTSGHTSRPTDVASRFGETMERVEIASRIGKEKCLTPTCTSFGNSKCRGYCNSCFVKLQRPSFV